MAGPTGDGELSAKPKLTFIHLQNPLRGGPPEPARTAAGITGRSLCAPV